MNLPNFNREPRVDLPEVSALTPVASTKPQLRMLARASILMGQSTFVRTSQFSFDDTPGLPDTGPNRLVKGLKIADEVLVEACDEVGIQPLPHDWVIIPKRNFQHQSGALPSGFMLGARVAAVRPTSTIHVDTTSINSRIYDYQQLGRPLYLTDLRPEQLLFGTTIQDHETKHWMVDIEPRISTTPHPRTNFFYH